jgi:RNA recognition motif-containing protein
VFDVLPKDTDLEGYMKDISFIFTKLPGNIQKIVFVSQSEGMDIFIPLLQRPKIIIKKSVDGNLKDLSQKETKGMSDILTDSMQSAIDLMIKQVKEKEEPELLTDYKKLFKKSVPFMVRPWVTAFLFKEALARYSSNNGKKNVKDGVNLFVGVGKKRKVYPKDLIQLFIEKGKISREDIGDIKILDSYSFVMINKESADKLIKNMNGLSFRGRKLNVNYAKKK